PRPLPERPGQASIADVLPSFALRPAHLEPAPQRQARRCEEGYAINGGHEGPGIHSAILRIRASALETARIARIRISTIAAKNRVKPRSVNGSGQSIEPAMVDEVRPMLSPWWSVFHHTTE